MQQSSTVSNGKFSLKHFKGSGGIGKSTALKHLALSWAEGNVEDLKRFDFVFHVALKDITSEQSIEQIIVKQHKGLSGNNVQPDEIRKLLDVEGRQDILILLDGHDEYKRNNKCINEALIKSRLRNCWIVVTSRETKHLFSVRQCIDAEAQITGFNPKRVKQYVYKYLEDPHDVQKFFQQVKKSELIDNEDTDEDSEDEDFKSDYFNGDDLEDEDSDSDSDSDRYGILHIPILLHMICVLFIRKESLPNTRTGVIAAIVDRCENWERIRNTGEKGIKSFESILLKLGKFIFKKLQQDNSVQVFDKVQYKTVVKFKIYIVQIFSTFRRFV